MAAPQSHVLVIETDGELSTQAGGTWWDVPVAQVSSRPATQAAHAKYLEAKKAQRLVR